MTTRGQSLSCVTLVTNISTQLDSQILFLGGHFRWVDYRARWRTLDKVMKMLGVEVTSIQGKDVTPIVHYNLKGISMGDGRNWWFIAFWGYVVKLNPTIDDTQRQLVEELKAIKEELDMGFEYLDHPLAFKHVRDQVATMLKGRQGWFKKEKEKRWKTIVKSVKIALDPI